MGNTPEPEIQICQEKPWWQYAWYQWTSGGTSNFPISFHLEKGTEHGW